MRKLTIKREKSFVGRLGTMKVYIEDAASSELTMTVMKDEKPEQISCRKIGELKNGEEVTFEISEDAAMLFVIADTLSKDYCNDCYQLPEGSDDISLSGRNRLNPAAANAFRFDKNESKVATVGRQRGMKRGLIILIAFVIIGFSLGYGITAGIFGILDSRERTFESNGMTVTLNEGFKQQSVAGYAAVFVSKNVEIVALKTKFSDFGTSVLNAAEFAKAGLLSNKDIQCEVIEKDGLVCYSFNATASDNRPYVYYVYTYKSDDSYWQLYFAVEEGKAKRYADDIAEWAGSVNFN